MSWKRSLKDGASPEWPYPIRYDVENEVSVDLLVLGGGPAGCEAAISAAKKGLTVAIVEKGIIKRGGGGSGCDHWNNTPNPCSKITAEECVEWERESNGHYCNEISRYIAARESYDTLLELEKMGAKIRDTEDEFKGAPFRDVETKFLFSYDYENKFQFTVWGTTFKPALYRECKRLRIQLYERVQATSLLTEGGRQGARVVGATGLNVRTGEFYLFKAKATVLCVSRHQRNWVFSTELAGLCDHRPNVAGSGMAMAWRAGAEFTMMEKSKASIQRDRYPDYGVGCSYYEWHPCTIVDADGKEIPWVDYTGRILKGIDERARPAPGQKFLAERATVPQYRVPTIISDLNERIMKGEFALPLYADLPSMPDDLRRVIWGVHVGEEGRTHIPVLKTYTEAGFDPTRDMLQCYTMMGVGFYGEQMRGPGEVPPPYLRAGGESGSAGGLLNDWDLKTSLDGLFAAGDALFGGNYYNHACATGRYAGRKAAEYALKARDPVITRRQVDDEKARVYGPVERQDGIEWKELNAVSCRIMQNYCGEPKCDELLKIGLIWLKDIDENEVPKASAGDPHKLGRTLDVFDIITCDQIIIHSCLARKASSKHLGLIRADYRDLDPPEWHKWITVKQEKGKVKVGELPIDFHGDLKSNYESRNSDYDGYYKRRG